jgi:tetratricopeptide (TPR) repeat protein
MDDAAVVLAEAVERGREAGVRVVAADAALALSELRFQRHQLTRPEIVREVDTAVSVFTEAGDEAGLARALTLGGKLRFWSGEAAAAVADLERAARYARAAGDRAEEAESVQYACRGHTFGPTPVAHALVRLDELHPRAEDNGRLEISLLENRARLEAMRGRFDVARGVLERARMLAEELGLQVLASRVVTTAGYVELLADDAVAAERQERLACDTLERFGELGYLASAVPLLLDALYDQGRDDEALELSERWRPERTTVPEDVDAQAGWRSIRGKIVARRGDAADGERLAREAVALAAPTDYLDRHAQASAALGDVLVLAGRPREAATAYEEAVQVYGRKGNVVSASRVRRVLAGLGAATATPPGAPPD